MKKKCIFTLSLLLVSLVGFAIEQLTLGSYTYTVDTLENYKQVRNAIHLTIEKRCEPGDAFS